MLLRCYERRLLRIDEADEGSASTQDAGMSEKRWIIQKVNTKDEQMNKLSYNAESHPQASKQQLPNV